MKVKLTALLSIGILAMFITSCEWPTTYLPSQDLSEAEQAYTLSAPANLQATTFDGYVWLSWNPVPNAQQYAVYRSLPIQTGIDAGQDTAFQLLGLVDARAPNVYTTRAATVGGGTTYLDYVNLDNPLEVGNYTYAVAALRFEDDETDIKFADGSLSSSVNVTLAAIPAPNTRLAAPASVIVESELGGRWTYISWPKEPLAKGYLVFRLDLSESGPEDILDALAEDDPELRDQKLFETGLMYPLGYNSELNGEFSWDYYLVESNAIRFETDPLGYSLGRFEQLLYAVVSIPQDEYFRPSNVTMQALPVAIMPAPELTASTDHEDEIILIWDAVYGATDYEVYRSETGIGGWTQLVTDVTDFIPYGSIGDGVWFVDDDAALEAGIGVAKAYYYRVRALFGTDTGSFSNIAAGSITALAGESYLATPILVATDGLFTNKIELTWGAIDDADQYMIYRSDSNAGTYNLLAGPSAFAFKEADETTLFYEDEAVVAGENAVDRLYYYKIVAINTAFGTPPTTIYSAMSDADSGYVAPNEVVEAPVEDTLAAPAILFNQRGAVTTSISVQWENVLADTVPGALAAQSYELYVSTAAAGEYTHLLTITGTTVTYQPGYTAGASVVTTALDTGYDARVILTQAGFGWERGVEYFFRMKSVNTTENMYSVLSTDTSNWLDTLDPGVITGSWETTDDIGPITGELTMGMTELVTGAESYQLIVSTNPDLNVGAARVEEYTLVAVDLADLLIGEFVYEVTGLAESTTYSYGIRAYSGDVTAVIGEVSYSNVLSFTTPVATGP